ncbi:4Fe-4S dicluster domain-containing protein [Acetobacteraceae bacterium]|nr:4Fe-4S dicluster domain-containing protein [Acetobacteraceae bacterium]
MLKLIKDTFTKKAVTTHYPEKPFEVVPNFRGKPDYKSNQCICCAACTNACPANALTIEIHESRDVMTWAFDTGRCIFCARCEEVCPTGAIRLSENFEMAVWKKEDLVEKADFKICRCVQCGAPYASQKEIEYAMDILGFEGEEREKRRDQFETCTDCKQQNDLLPAHLVKIDAFIPTLEGK